MAVVIDQMTAAVSPKFKKVSEQLPTPLFRCGEFNGLYQTVRHD